MNTTPYPTPDPARGDPSLPHSGRSYPSKGEDYYNKDDFDLIIIVIFKVLLNLGALFNIRNNQ